MPSTATVAKYRKKPVVIDAVQYTGREGKAVIADWCGGDSETVPDAILINTLEGVMRADLDDWIIKGVAGEFYPCKPAVFAKSYEPDEPDVS